jgi:serine/threonine protein kinase KIN1/2
LTSLVPDGGTSGTSRQGSNLHSPEASTGSTIRRGVVRKASKLTFATVRRKDKAKDNEQSNVVVPVTPTPTTPGHSVPPSAVLKSDDKELPNRPSVSANAPAAHPPVTATASSRLISASGGSSSFFNVPSPSAQVAETRDEEQEHVKDSSMDKGTSPPSIRNEGEAMAPDQEHEDIPADLDKALAASAVPEEPLHHHQQQGSSSLSPTREKFLPPIPKDFVPPPPASPSAKMTMAQQQVNVNELFEASGSSDLIVRFEIMIVKVSTISISIYHFRLIVFQVPLLPLHGIQFRRIGGDIWQYHMLARRVLTELKL